MKIRQAVDRLTAAFAALGAVAIGAIMALTVADVVRRTLTDTSISGVVEVAPLLLLSAAALGLGYAELTRVHVRTSMVTGRLPRAPRLVLRSAGSIVSTILLGWVTSESFSRALTSIENHDVTPGFTAYPTWPALVLVPIGFGLFALHIALRLVDDLRALRSGAPDPLADETMALIEV